MYAFSPHSLLPITKKPPEKLLLFRGLSSHFCYSYSNIANTGFSVIKDKPASEINASDAGFFQ